MTIRFELASARLEIAARDRRAVRRAVRIPCEVVRERDFRLVSRLALDVSSAGMRVAALVEVLTGEPLIVSFRIPDGDWVDTEASVARVSHGRRTTDFGLSVGVHFNPLESDVRRRLQRALGRLPGLAPRRDFRVDYAATVRRITFGCNALG